MTKVSLILAVLGLLLPAALTRAAETAGADSQGKQMYVKYCGACHGPAGKGDGIAGTFMRPKPADLTQIAKKSGGEFPFQRTMEVIDGRQSVRAHGDPDMPVWGEILSEEATDSRSTVVKGTLVGITNYIRSIQVK